MDHSTREKISRRQMLKSVAAAAGLAVMPGVAPGDARAQAKASKAQMKYQDKPNGKQQCDNCMQYVPGKSPSANGTCKVVDGDISPKGWCIAWAAKPS